ncbi:hypothetical protein [Methylibium sp.]|uniref:hypothetical protein n=1 Tax=Methylibium sp. TaxID=2067992 RepID=UPI0025D0EDA7|nr:hypothetical protein [Methylibium sp.]
MDTDTWLAMVEQSQAAGTQIVRRTEEGKSRVFVRIGAKAALVQVDSLDQLEDLIAADAAPLLADSRCTNRYSR